MKPHIKKFLERLADENKKPLIELPQDMKDEIKRIGMEEAQVQYWALTESLEFAREMLMGESEEKALFEKWFPKLEKFAREKRQANPFPQEESLSKFERAIKRILLPRIESEGGLRQLRYHVPIFSAPLVVLPLVAERFSSLHENPIFLTPDESAEWNNIYEVPEDAPWWNFYYSWTAEPNPPKGGLWIGESDFSMSSQWTPVLVSSGSCWGPLGGSWSADLWAIDNEGNEQFIEDLGICVS